MPAEDKLNLLDRCTGQQSAIRIMASATVEASRVNPAFFTAFYISEVRRVGSIRPGLVWSRTTISLCGEWLRDLQPSEFVISTVQIGTDSASCVARLQVLEVPGRSGCPSASAQGASGSHGVR